MLGLLILSTIFCFVNSSIDLGDHTPFLLIGILNLLLIFIFYYTKSITIAGNAFVFIWGLSLAEMSINTGGIYSMDSFSLILIPLTAYSLIGQKSGNFWLGCFLIFIVYLWNLAANPENNLQFLQDRNQFDRSYYLAGQLMIIIFLIGIFSLIAYHYKQLVLQLKLRQDELNDNLGLLKEQSKLLEQSKIELQRSNTELEEYANATSHDLKQPIRNVNNFAALLHRHLSKQDKLDTRSEEMLGFITEGSDRMLTLISDLLDFARLKTEKERVFKAVDLNIVVERVLFNLKSQIKKTGTVIEVNSLPKTMVIPIKLGQVFQNLISNAIKFRRKESPLAIQIQATEEEEHFLISIQDNGIGIEKEFQEQIFTPFKKLHTPSEYKGSGVGLATCRHVIDLHLGKIWVESELGKGSTFYFTISKLLNNNTMEEGKLIVSNPELN